MRIRIFRNLNIIFHFMKDDKYLKGTSKNPLKIRSKCSAGIEIATFATTLSKHR